MPNKTSLHLGNYYHLYNRGNNHENIFRSPENYRFFLQRYTHYIEPVAKTYAYCLLPNHFHFLVRIREETLPEQTWKVSETFQVSTPQVSPQEKQLKRGKKVDSTKPLSPKIVSQQFSNLFNTYTKAFNKMHQRTGSLFAKNFRRKHVDNPRYYTHLITYIHHNPQRHGLVDDFRDWAWSSYRAMVAEEPTRVARQDVLLWYGGRAGFVEAHKREAQEWLIRAVNFE